VTLQECKDLNGKAKGATNGAGRCVIVPEDCDYDQFDLVNEECGETCPGQLYIASELACIDSCPLGYYYDEFGSNCYQCGANCVKCSNDYSCDLCEAGALEIYDDNTCYFECRAGTYNSWNNGPKWDQAPYCRECDSSCSECFWSGP